MTSTQVALAKALDMKLKGTQIKGYKLKSGELVKTDKTPAPLRKGNHAKAAREEKAWRTKSRKTTDYTT